MAQILVVVVIVVVAFERLFVEILMQLVPEPEDALASFPTLPTSGTHLCIPSLLQDILLRHIIMPENQSC